MERAKIGWKLPQVLEQENISAYRLAQELSKLKVGANTVYRWAREPQDSIKLDTLASVLWGLRQITGCRFEVGDLLEYQD